MRVPKSICAIAECCDSGSARYALGGVLFGRDNKKPFAVATDGRRLVHATWDEDLLLEFPGENAERMSQMLVSGKSVKELATLCNGSRGADKKRFYLDESVSEKVAARFSEPGTLRQLETAPVEGRFPKWQDITNDATREPVASVRIAGKLLLSTLKAVVSLLELDGTEGVTLELSASKVDRTTPNQLRISGSQNGTTVMAVQMALEVNK